MSNTLEVAISELQKEFSLKVTELQQTQQYHLIAEVAIELQKKIEALVSTYTEEVKAKGLSLIPAPSQYYRQADCDFDLDAVVYDGDRDYFNLFMDMPELKELMNQASRASVSNSKRELLKHAMRVSPGMAPKIQNALERCKTKLGLKTKVDVFVAQDPAMNAFCYPPHEGSAYILVTSSLLEKLTEDELTFVIGHELGHFLFQHHLLNPDYIGHALGHAFSPAEMIKLFSWKRNAELTADRIGLVCCESFDVACLANFKIASGVSSDALSFSLDSFLDQYKDMEEEMKGAAPNMQDYYSTHPINPMRVIALDVFNRSETYSPHSFEFTEKQMEDKIAGFMSLMEPTYLDSNVDAAKEIKKILFLGGYIVAQADGVIDEKELANLGELLTPTNLEEMLKTVQGWDAEMAMTALSEQIEKAMPHLSFVTVNNIVRDLVVVSLADGEMTENEFQCLCTICTMMGIHPCFIDQVLSSIAVQAAA